jgi:hypothetical protein
MFTKRDTEDIQLQAAIDAAYESLSHFSAEDPEYAKITAQLTALYALKEDKTKKRVSPDTLAMVFGNLLGIVLIVGHERANVITSRAITFVSKLK